MSNNILLNSLRVFNSQNSQELEEYEAEQQSESSLLSSDSVNVPVPIPKANNQDEPYLLAKPRIWSHKIVKGSSGPPGAGPSTSTPTSTITNSPNKMDYIRSSKFAQILGFGTSSEANNHDLSPVTLNNLEDISYSYDEFMNQEVPSPSPPSSSGYNSSRINFSTPLEPSFNQINSQTFDTQWSMNYQEAGIYLEEGENNDKFSAHPKERKSLPAYILAHTEWFYIVDWLASLVLISLAIIEPPAIITNVPIGVHASLELGALGIISLGLILKARWLGVRAVLRHHRTVLKTITLFIMFVEAILVLVRQTSHFRVTRALRPIFLVDNRYLRGVRRFSRQTLQSVPPILDMLLLLFFFIIIFTLLGHFLFGHDPDDPFFTTIDDSFVSLFVLLTTANFPDVMMPSYSKSSWAVFFFVAYLVTVLYLFMNLLLAVVYDTFTTIEKEKFRKLVVHKRNACNLAFNLLVSKANTTGITFRHFYGMMKFYSEKKSLRDIYLTFKALNKTGDGLINREEFTKFYEVSNLKWKPVRSIRLRKEWMFFKEYGVLAQKFLESTYSNHLFNVLILLNTLAMVARWLDGQTSQESWDSYVFSFLFLLEMTLKIFTWGFDKVITSGWHTFDLISSVAFMFSLIFVKFIPSWNELLTFIRPLRLLRLFKLKKRYRNVFGTLFILIPPMSSVAIVILLLYYFFAIIGMEIFSSVPLRNCCNGTLMEDYYSDTANPRIVLRYYLNSFENLFASFVTLFELTVVNNWYVIMEGYRIATDNRTVRVYFITFYLVMMCLLTIIVAFILDTFLFRMQYKRSMDKKTEQRMLRTEVSLTSEEIDFCYKPHGPPVVGTSTANNQQNHSASSHQSQRSQILQDYGEDLATRGCVNYVGWRRRTKEILFKRMYNNEIPDWIRETGTQHHRDSSTGILTINH